VPWRIGHFERALPAGYFSSGYHSNNIIEDADIAEFYDQIRLITRGELFSPARWQAIWKMNTGQFNDLIPARCEE
jgi:arabinofuranosyltransferase